MSIANTLKNLRDEVHAATTVTQSTIQLINGLAQRIADWASSSGVDDDAELQAILAEVRENKEALAAAVLANTPSEVPEQAAKENAVEGAAA